MKSKNICRNLSLLNKQIDWCISIVIHLLYQRQNANTVAINKSKDPFPFLGSNGKGLLHGGYSIKLILFLSFSVAISLLLFPLLPLYLSLPLSFLCISLSLSVSHCLSISLSLSTYPLKKVLFSVKGTWI